MKIKIAITNNDDDEITSGEFEDFDDAINFLHSVEYQMDAELDHMTDRD